MSSSGAVLLLVASLLSPAAAFLPRSNTPAPPSVSLPMTASASDAAAGGSYLATVPEGPPDAILGIAAAFRACTHPDAVNVCVGAYRGSDGKPWVLPSVRAAEEKMAGDAAANKEYLPIEGDAAFVGRALRFAYGEEEYEGSTTAAVQSLSGTGACRIGAALLAKFAPKVSSDGTKPLVLVPDPTWGNHFGIFREAGCEAKTYRYYDRRTNRLDFDGMLADLSAAPRGSVVLLHACAHNPTGCDPSPDQWDAISSAIADAGLQIFFDSAYQGFASGDAEADAAALRKVVGSGRHRGLMLAQSFAKNFGLYGERTGTFSVLCASPEERAAVQSQLKLIVRPMYSSPPRHGSSIVSTVLGDDGLRPQYYGECREMAERIAEMRALLVVRLGEKGSTHDWSHVAGQIGMFAFTGMSAEMVDELTAKYYIFLTRDGRISLAGLNANNIDYVAGAVHAVTDGKKITAE